MPHPIVLVPGLNCTAECFIGQIPAIWQFGPVQVADHKRGATIAEIATAILADAPPTFALGGFSMGGYIAFEMLRQAPERVTRLALIDTMARPDNEDQALKRRDSIRLAQQGKLVQLVTQNFPNGVHPANAGRSDLRELQLRMASQNGAEVYVRQQNAILTRPDSRGDLVGIKVPTTIVVGETDSVTPVDAAHEMADAIPDADLVTIAGAGHMSPTEQPAAVAAALAGWLAR